MSGDPADLEARARILVDDLGIGTVSDVRAVRPLTGGVASDIAAVELPGHTICVKFALARLRVAADWRAPVHRNGAEYRWLEFAGSVVPEAVPQLFGRSEALNGFAMEYLDPADTLQWKGALLAQHSPPGQARKVGESLGRIHLASTLPGFDRTGFDNRADFMALRIEPYLLHTAAKHADLAPEIRAIADQLDDANRVLVHGDVSPKNILIRSAGPVLLDAECATMGDPSFDLAFCLNHLMLKAIHLPATRGLLFDEVAALREAYLAHVRWEQSDALEARAAALLPVLMLARVDGKSPVEYLDESERALVRDLARPLIAEPPSTLSEFVERIRHHLDCP